MGFLGRWRRKKVKSDAELDDQTREQNARFRAHHDGMMVAQPAADRWQRQIESEFKPPSY
jgi:hypothetical protein